MAMIVKGSPKLGNNYNIINPLNGANLWDITNDLDLSYWYSFNNFNPVKVIIQRLPKNTTSPFEQFGSFVEDYSCQYGEAYAYHSFLSLYHHGEILIDRNLLKSLVSTVDETFCAIFINENNDILMDTFTITM